MKKSGEYNLEEVKKHPNAEDIENAKNFAREIIDKC